MLTLFNIEKEYLDLTNEIIENEGELTPELDQRLSITKNALEYKANQYAHVIKTLDHEVDAIDKEIERLTAMKKARSSAKERLKAAVSDAMQIFGITEIKGELMKLYFKKTESVVVDDADKLPPEFVETKITYSPLKNEIKKAIKEGQEIEGAHISENYHLQIK